MEQLALGFHRLTVRRGCAEAACVGKPIPHRAKGGQRTGEASFGLGEQNTFLAFTRSHWTHKYQSWQGMSLIEMSLHAITTI